MLEQRDCQETGHRSALGFNTLSSAHHLGRQACAEGNVWTTVWSAWERSVLCVKPSDTYIEASGLRVLLTPPSPPLLYQAERLLRGSGGRQHLGGL